MLDQCLNPACRTSFRYLYDGRIFTVEHCVTSADTLKTDRQIEHYWLCGECSKSMKVVVENGAVTTARIEAELLIEAHSLV
jgi:hypothetical protein